MRVKYALSWEYAESYLPSPHQGLLHLDRRYARNPFLAFIAQETLLSFDIEDRSDIGYTPPIRHIMTGSNINALFLEGYNPLSDFPGKHTIPQPLSSRKVA